MSNKRGQRAGLLLEVLAEEEMRRVLRLFEATGPLSPQDCERLLADIGRSRVRRRLSAGQSTGILSHERSSGLPPHVRYALKATQPHFDAAYTASIAWEQAWDLGSEPHEGLFALQAAAHPLWVTTVATLADAPLAFTELEQRIGGPHSTLWDYIQSLVADQLLERIEGPEEKVLYASPENARRLAVVPVIAVSMEWSLGRVVNPAYASNLYDLVHALAPLAVVEQDIGGDCHLHVDCRDCMNPDVYVRIDSGRLLPLQAPPEQPPAAVAHATPAGWCEALLACRPTATSRTGSHRLFCAALTALSGALVPAQVAGSLREI